MGTFDRMDRRPFHVIFGQCSREISSQTTTTRIRQAYSQFFLGTLSFWPCFPLPAPVFCQKQRVAGSDNGRNIKEDNNNNEDGGKTTTFDSAAPVAT